MSTNVPIASVTLSAATPSVVFSGIPQTYTDLFLVCNIGQSASNNSLRIRYNSDTGSNYSYTALVGNGSSTYSGRDVNLTCGLVAETTASANIDLTVIANIQNYSNSTTYKTHIGRGNRADGTIDAVVGLWRSISAITSIELAMGSGFPSNNFASGSTFNLYGINSANSAQAKATGGDTIIRDASYWYHVFNKSGTFTPAQNLTNVDYLVIAGGGAGGGTDGGGGGGGGLRYSSSNSLTAFTNYTMTIGAGGTAAPAYSQGTNGSNSSISGTGFTTFSSTGGGKGGGGSGPQTFGSSGGSGGGGGGNTSGGSNNYPGGAGNAGGYSPVEGFAGGNGNPTEAPRLGGGGGGAGGVGGNGNATPTGGPGVNTYSAIATATLTGVNGYYAGGGGAGGQGSSANGGSGGGGNGSGGGNGAAGTANTGGGGGGGGNDSGGGAGGSGIIIVRYPV